MSRVRSREAKLRQQAARRKRLMQRIWDYKASRLCKCGESRPQCLEFHHTDPTGKDDEIVGLARKRISWQKILTEIEKCEIMCANCHRVIHYSKNKLRN